MDDRRFDKMSIKKSNVLYMSLIVAAGVLSPGITYAESDQEVLEEQENIQVEQADDVEVEIQDESLRTILLKNVQNNGFDQITEESLESLTELEGARGANIESLEGLQYAKHLVKADLRENQIRDLTPL